MEEGLNCGAMENKANCVAGILPAIRRRDAFDTAITKLRLTLPPGARCLLCHSLVARPFQRGGAFLISPIGPISPI